MNTIYYLYPIHNKVSFHFISKQHIRYLRQKLKNNVRIVEADVDSFDPTAWGLKRKLIIHPLFYPFFDGVSPTANVKLNKLNQCLNKGYDIIAFDTADSDRISDRAVDLANKVVAVIVPSKFAKEVFEKSGVATPLHVVPHGIPDEFMTENREITHPDFAKLKELKEDKGFVYVHFNITHSGRRKGCDLFAKAMSMVQKENPNIIILAKRLEGLDPYLPLLRQLRCIEIGSYLDLDAYRQLYDLSDITVLASRGGGFECVPPDTKIICYDGVKPISEVKEGDLVLTHKGRFRKVTKVFKRYYKGKIVEIIPYGFSNVSIKLTPEHPVLAIIRKGKARNSINSNLEWVEAKELKKGDFVVFPIPSNNCKDIVYDLAEFSNDDSLVVEDEWIYYNRTGSPRFTEISYKDVEKLTNETKKIVCKAVKAYKGELNTNSDRVKKVVEFLRKINYEPQYVKIKRFVKFDKHLAKVIGYYLAEGNISAKGCAVEFSFGEEPELVSDLVNAIIHAFNYIPSVKQYRNGKLTKVIISNKVIAKFLETLCGKKAHGKRIPLDCYKLDLDTISWLIWSMVLGDGCVYDNQIRYITVSKDLAFGVYTLLVKLGYKPRIEYREYKTYINPINKSAITKQWTVDVTLPNKTNGKNPSNNPLTPRKEDYILHSNKRYLDFKRGFMISIIKDVKIVDYDGYVYNLEVEEDNSYVANLITVHNCNALESLARGVPTIVPKAGCFLDYIKYTIPVRVTKNKPIVLPDNPIHIGRGWEIDVEELARTILKVADNLSKYKRIARRNMKKIWKEYSWSNIANEIIKILSEYDFIKV